MKSTVAVVGASQVRDKFGNKCVRAFASKGYEVYPVHPKEKEVEGFKCYASISDVPGQVDVISVYLPPPVGLKELDAIARKGAKKVYFNPGTESPEIMAKAKTLKIEAIFACSIVAIGLSPSMFP